MNRTLRKATVRRYRYSTHQQMSAHLATFLDAYNFAKRLNTLSGFTTYEAICNDGRQSQSAFYASPPSSCRD